ncbi:hypothetical protein ACIXN4_07560 [Bacteroides fragilis]
MQHRLAQTSGCLLKKKHQFVGMQLNIFKISIRESSTIDLCYDKLGKKPEFVLDPTLLLDNKFYSGLIENMNLIEKESYVHIFSIRKA